MRMDDKLLFRVDEAAELLSVSKRFLCYEIVRGRIRPVRLGTAVRIPRVELDRYVERLIAEAATQEPSAIVQDA
jgi:excisionase family DNA binding protein